MIGTSGCPFSQPPRVESALRDRLTRLPEKCHCDGDELHDSRRAETRACPWKPPLRHSEGVGVEAFFVEEEDAGAKGEEHDGDAGGDAKAGGDGGGTIVAAADNDVTGDDDQKFQDAALEQPGDETGDHSWGVAEIGVKEDGPEDPEATPEEQKIGWLVEELFPEIVAPNGEAQRPDYRRGKKRGENGTDGDGNKDMGARFKAFLGRVHWQEKQESLTEENGDSRNPEEPILVGFAHTAEEFCPVINVPARKKDNCWDDQAQEDQDVEDGDDDAPFAHGPSWV